MRRGDKLYRFKGIESSYQTYPKRDPDETESEEPNIDSDGTMDSDESI